MSVSIVILINPVFLLPAEGRDFKGLGWLAERQAQASQGD
jgi:hypothetical protein